MSSRHLTCLGCRIRVRANAPEIALLEGRCPICGATLRPGLSASRVVGFRSFDLDVLSQHGSVDSPDASEATPAGFAARREAASAWDYRDAARRSDGGGVKSEAVAKWPTPY